MPIYEYRCSQCGRDVEVMHAIGAAGPTACEVCGGAMRKSLSLPAVHFKGSGWAKKDAAAATRSKPTSDSGTDSGSTGKGDKGTKQQGSGNTGGSEGSGSTTAAPASTDTKAD